MACAAALYHIQAQSIWFDEGWSAYAALQPSVQAAAAFDQTNPPLYYVLLNLAVRGIGDSAFALRWVSTAFGLLTVALAYRLGRQLFNSRAGMFAALLVALSPLMWWAGQEARMYTLLAALVLVCALAWHHVVQQTRPGWYGWLLLGGAELALLYAHNTGPVAALWLNGVTALALVTVKRADRWRWLGRWLVCQAAVGLLWLPYFANRFLRLTEANSAVTSTTPFTLETLGRFWQALWAGSWTLVGREPLLVGLAAVLFGAALLLIPWRKANARWLVLHVAILTAGLWLALSLLGNEVHGRYLVMIAPLLLVAFGAGLARMSRRVWGLTGAAVGLVAFTFGAAVHFNTTNPAYQHDDARGMVQYYADHLTAADSVLMWSYADRYELAYYWERLGVQAKRVTLPEGADLEAVLPLLPASGDVALNVWYTQRADFRGMMGCLLGDGTVNEPERFDSYGMTSLVFRAPALQPPVLQPFEARLSMARISAIGVPRPAPADRAICVPIQLTLTQPAAVDLKAAVSLHNGFGQPIARTDASFADRVQRLSSQLPAGSVLTAYVLLRLPYGSPAGDYTLAVRIYDEQVQPSGYSLTLADGQTRGDIQLGLNRTAGSDWSAARRTVDLPISANLSVPNTALRLVAHDVQGGRYRNGDRLTLSFLWEGTGLLPDVQIAADDGSWQVDIPASSANHDQITRDWRQAQIPLDAASGTAVVRLPDGTPIGSINVEAIPALYQPPAVEVAVNRSIPGVGFLTGYTLHGDPGDRSQPFIVDLVWQAAQPTAASYTVFVQLVAANGQVLAQSDALPAQGSRPTTGWRSGEYIVDTHTVNFHADAAATTATLIAGLYDAASGQRVPVTAATDSITLLADIPVR